MTSIHQDQGVPDAEEMVRSLVEGHEAVALKAREAFKIANRSKDEASVDLLTGRLTLQEKTAWMLRSPLVKSAMAAV